MNRVFVSGSIGANPRVSYTPKGQKIITFPIWVEDGGFSIDVVFSGESRMPDALAAIGKRVVVSGVLANMKSESRNVLRVRASQILPMEE